MSSDLLDKKGDEEASAGSRFTVRPDPEDPRFDLISIRMPNVSFVGGTPRDPVDLRGEEARWRICRFAAATAGGIAHQLGLPDGDMRVLFNEVRVQEVSIERKPELGEYDE